MRTISQISDELEKLYSELDIVQSMSEELVRLTFNAECKGKYISLLNGKSSVSCPLKPSDSAPLC
ncbi:hypothetical protein [Phocaeicola dorei]|uniref:hypothetical protein n=1 Tax=Phocaeicola dorei TaxID=357276 RepID=UPI0035636EA5